MSAGSCQALDYAAWKLANTTRFGRRAWFGTAKPGYDGCWGNKRAAVLVFVTVSPLEINRG